MRILSLLFVLTCSQLIAQTVSEYEAANYLDGADTLRYRILKPKNKEADKKYPLVIFLHGSGERGQDNSAQLKHGSSLFTSAENRENFKAYVVFPQCPEGDYWANISYTNEGNGLGFGFKKQAPPQKSLKMVLGLLDELLKRPDVDTSRVYVMGLSMGGMATYELLQRRPTVFAAAIPICGGANTENAQLYAENTPVWIFHGTDDRVIHPKYSIEMATAINEAGGSPRLNLYDKTGHDSWTRAFAEPDFLSWLFSHGKKH